MKILLKKIANFIREYQIKLDERKNIHFLSKDKNMRMINLEGIKWSL